MNILIADDHLLFLEGITTLLESHFSTGVISHAYDYEQLEKALGGDVDLLIMDLRMPGVKKGRNYIELIRDYSTLPIIILSASENQAEVDAVMKAGAMAFIPKASSAEFLIQIIQQVIEGEKYYPKLAYSSINTDLDDGLADALKSSVKLSKRHLEVLQYLAEGLTTPMIAKKLYISEHTVKTHLVKVYKSLCVKNRVECVQKARLIGLL